MAAPTSRQSNPNPPSIVITPIQSAKIAIMDESRRCMQSGREYEIVTSLGGREVFRLLPRQRPGCRRSELLGLLEIGAQILLHRVELRVIPRQVIDDTGRKTDLGFGFRPLSRSLVRKGRIAVENPRREIRRSLRRA